LKQQIKRILRITLGIVLIILGIAAALTPFSPGSWLALIGLEILGLRLLFQRKLLSWTPKKYRRRLKRLFSTTKKKT
jgi:membrane protein implicated in regulation of membrane protease activity